MDVVAGVAHADAVALALMGMEGRLGHHLMHQGLGYAVDGPLIEAVECGVLFEEHIEGFVGLRG